MGKGRILTAHGEGRYTIELLEDRARANAARALAVERVAALDTRISELEVDLAEAQAEVDSAADALDQAIAAYQAEIQAEGDSDVDTTTPATELQEAAAKRDAIAADIRALKVQRLAAQRRIDLIDGLPPLRQQEAWCADFTDDLAGEVATAEVPGEAAFVQVRPGYSDGAAYDQARDGALQPAIAGTAAGVFYNLAMLPGWQKWRPTYRYATISNIDTDTDTCSINLEAATSSQQGLDVNAQTSYADVPIDYMDCNAGAFEDGDSVIVEFGGDTAAPKVIGFKDNPRDCCNYQFLVGNYLEQESTGLENACFEGISIEVSKRICVRAIFGDITRLNNDPDVCDPGNDAFGHVVLYKCSSPNTPTEILLQGEIWSVVETSEAYPTETNNRVESDSPIYIEAGEFIMLAVMGSTACSRQFSNGKEFNEVVAADDKEWIEAVYPQGDINLQRKFWCDPAITDRFYVTAPTDVIGASLIYGSDVQDNVTAAHENNVSDYMVRDQFPNMGIVRAE